MINRYKAEKLFSQAKGVDAEFLIGDYDNLLY